MIIVSDVKAKPVHDDQSLTNGCSQPSDVKDKTLQEGPMDKVTTMFPTVWFGAQSGRYC